MSKLSNPHNDFFVSTFSDRLTALDYVRHFLPKEIGQLIDENTFEKDNTSYITSKLESYASDVVYHCLTKDKASVRVAFLFEHKSYRPKYPHLQLMQYMVNIWEDDEKQKRPLSAIIPIIIYHGHQKWAYRPLISYFENFPAELKKFLPIFDYHFTNIMDYEDEELYHQIPVPLVNVFLALKHSRNKATLFKLLPLFFDFLAKIVEEERKENFKTQSIVYILNATKMKEKQFFELVDSMPEIKIVPGSTLDNIIRPYREEKEKIVKEIKQLAQEKERIVQEKEQVVQEKEQVVQEKEQVVREKEQVVREKERINAEKKLLREQLQERLKKEKRLEAAKIEAEKRSTEMEQERVEIEGKKAEAERERAEAERKKVQAEAEAERAERERAEAERQLLNAIKELLYDLEFSENKVAKILGMTHEQLLEKKKLIDVAE